MARRRNQSTVRIPTVIETARYPVRGGLLGTTALAALIGWNALAFTTPAHAQLPTGGTVVGGSATITTGTNQVTVNQTSNRGVIDWHSFSIGQGSRVDFQQPGASSVTLNRVTGPDPSVIAGRLTANGQIVLVNGAGVVFANGAQVNVGSLIASTANVASSQAFMADGKLAFDVRSSNANAGVVNDGSIKVRDGGLVGLVGNMAANNGVINARLGRVTIGGAETFTVDLAGDGLINFQVGNPVSRQPVDDKGRKLPLASNTGTINADGGVVQMTARAAGSVVDSVVNVGGAIRAQAVTQENGVLVLGAVTADAGDGGTVNVTGKIDVSGRTMGQRSGQVVATTQGGKVNVAATAVIDASGASGGGKVNIGGNYQGKGPLANARDTTVAVGARIAADATMHGNGGTVIVWADNATVFGGTITAKGGQKGGDGGFVETSGKGTLSVLPGAIANASATAGRAGTWLLDPTDMTIDATQAAGFSTVLQGGTDVVVTTSSAGTDAGDITLLAGANITWTTTNTLTLNADRGIFINGVISGTNEAAGIRVTLNAGITTATSGGIAGIGGTIDVGGGTLVLTAAKEVNFPGVKVSAGLVDFNTVNGMTATNVDNNIAAVRGSTTGGASISTKGALTVDPAGVTADSINLQSGGDLTVNGPVATSALDLRLSAGGQLFVNANVTSAAPSASGASLLLQSTGGSVSVASTATVSSLTNVNVTANSQIVVSGVISASNTVNMTANGSVGGVGILQTGGQIVANLLNAIANAGEAQLTSPTNDVTAIIGSAATNFRYVDANTVSIGQAFTVPIGITIGAGRYLEIAADTINILAGARIGGIATGSPGSSFPADNPTGVTVLRPTTANAPMVVGGAGGTTGTLLTEANLLASVQTGTLRLGSIGRAAGLQLGGAITTLENPTGTITIQGLNFSGAGQLLQRLVLESGFAGVAIQQTGAIRLTRGGGFEGALATAVRGGGVVELTNPNNSVTGLAHVARESDSTLAPQSGMYRYVDESSIAVVSVAGPGTPLIGDRNSGEASGAPASSAILINGGPVTLVSRGGSTELINGLAAIGAVARLNAAGDIFQSTIGGVVATGLLAVAGGAVDLSTAVGLNNVRFLSGSAAGATEGGLGDFRLINAASVTVPNGGVGGDNLVATVDGVHAGFGATLELAIASGDLTIGIRDITANNTTLTAPDGLVLLRRVAGATGSEIILSNVSFDIGSGAPNLVVLDLTGSPVLVPDSFAGLKTSATPPNGASAIPIGPNPDGGILLTNVNAGNTTVYLVGGAGSTIAGSGTYGLLGVYVAHSNPIALTGSVRQIDPTTPHAVTAPFSEPFDSSTFAGFYVRRRGAVVDVQTFNDCPIGSGICPTPPENEVHIPDRLQHPPDDPGRQVGVPDRLLIDFATDRPVPTPLGLSTVILVNQGNEYFFNVDEELRKQRAARGGK